MATAVQPTTATTPSNPRTTLAVYSLAAALFLLAGVAVAGYAVPQVWDSAVAPAIAPLGTMTSVLLRLIAQLAVVGGLVWAGGKLAGANPPRGLRGGIFLAVSLLITVFFVARAVGLNVAENVQVPAAVGVGVVGLALTWMGLTSPRAHGYSLALEEQGWFHTFNYKKTQGVRVRRYTLLGLLAVGLTGAYSLLPNQTHDLGPGTWALALPGTDAKLSLLTVLHFSVPMLIVAVTVWLAWRAVNVPPFADFLIATEAELNKVSWSTRKRLFQDTIVVLVTVVAMTTFLLVVDVFWGWLLSREVVGVLPGKADTAAQVDPFQGKKTDW